MFLKKTNLKTQVKSSLITAAICISILKGSILMKWFMGQKVMFCECNQNKRIMYVEKTVVELLFSFSSPLQTPTTGFLKAAACKNWYVFLMTLLKEAKVLHSSARLRATLCASTLARLPHHLQASCLQRISPFTCR